MNFVLFITLFTVTIYSTSDEPRTSSVHRSVSVQMTTPNIDEIELQDLQLLLPDFCLNLHRSALQLVEKCNYRYGCACLFLCYEQICTQLLFRC